MNIVMNVNPNRFHNIVGSCYKWNKYVSQQEVVKDISSLCIRAELSSVVELDTISTI